MPDPDRASLPLQIAGQAGNDDMVPYTSSSVMPFPLPRHAVNTKTGEKSGEMLTLVTLDETHQ